MYQLDSCSFAACPSPHGIRPNRALAGCSNDVSKAGGNAAGATNSAHVAVPRAWFVHVYSGIFLLTRYMYGTACLIRLHAVCNISRYCITSKSKQRTCALKLKLNLKLAHHAGTRFTVTVKWCGTSHRKGGCTSQNWHWRH